MPGGQLKQYVFEEKCRDLVQRECGKQLDPLSAKNQGYCVLPKFRDGQVFLTENLRRDLWLGITSMLVLLWVENIAAWHLRGSEQTSSV